MLRNILEKIKEYHTIIIHRHNRPDGDALGSQIGLKLGLQENFKDKLIYAVGDTNDRLKFMGNMDEVDNATYQGALAIVLDVAEEFMISDDRYKIADFVIKMDHHIEKTGFGNIKFVDTSYESCAGLITDFFYQNNLSLNEEAATALFTGIVTDSGRFRYSSTGERTFLLVSHLLKNKIDLEKIYMNLYSEDIDIVKLRAALTLKFEVTEYGVGVLKNTKEEVASYGADIFTISRGMVNIMAGIKGISIWANFTEDVESNKIWVELRSNGVNINEVAVKYGGGGHKLASGANVESWDIVDDMIEDLNQLAKGV
jgi:phosphoesterase RecJ-like protein